MHLVPTLQSFHETKVINQHTKTAKSHMSIKGGDSEVMSDKASKKPHKVCMTSDNSLLFIYFVLYCLFAFTCTYMYHEKSLGTRLSAALSNYPLHC